MMLRWDGRPDVVCTFTIDYENCDSCLFTITAPASKVNVSVDAAPDHKSDSYRWKWHNLAFTAVDQINIIKEISRNESESRRSTAQNNVFLPNQGRYVDAL